MHSLKFIFPPCSQYFQIFKTFHTSLCLDSINFECFSYFQNLFHFPIEIILSNTLFLFPIKTSPFPTFLNLLFKPPLYSFLFTPSSYFLILLSKLSSITSSFSSHPFKFQVFFFLLFKSENCNQHHGKSNKKEVHYKEEHKEKRRKLFKSKFRRREIGKIIPFYHSI